MQHMTLPESAELRFLTLWSGTGEKWLPLWLCFKPGLLFYLDVSLSSKFNTEHTCLYINFFKSRSSRRGGTSSELLGCSVALLGSVSNLKDLLQLQIVSLCDRFGAEVEIQEILPKHKKILFLLCGWQNTGRCCLEKLWQLHPCKCSKPNWTWPWSPCSSCPCSAQGGWTRWSPELPSHLSHYGILFYVSPFMHTGHKKILW